MRAYQYERKKRRACCIYTAEIMYPWAFRSLSLKMWAGPRKLAVPTRQVAHVPSSPPHVENERPPVHRPQMDKNSSCSPFAFKWAAES